MVALSCFHYANQNFFVMQFFNKKFIKLFKVVYLSYRFICIENIINMNFIGLFYVFTKWISFIKYIYIFIYLIKINMKNNNFPKLNIIYFSILLLSTFLYFMLKRFLYYFYIIVLYTNRKN